MLTEGKKSGLYPWASVQPPVVDLIGIEPELLAEIVRVETAD